MRRDGIKGFAFTFFYFLQKPALFLFLYLYHEIPGDIIFP